MIKIVTAALLLGLVAYSVPVSWLGPDTYDFGDIVHQQPVEYSFRFKNISDQPLVIDNVRTSCGCTVPQWPSEAVAPNDTGRITIEYDARDRGYFYKTVKVYFDGHRRAEKLAIEGYVE